MAITANPITARAITANPITAYPIDGSGGGSDCPLTFENGILNGGRVLCSGQLLLSADANASWVDGQLYIDGEPWFDN